MTINTAASGISTTASKPYCDHVFVASAAFHAFAFSILIVRYKQIRQIEHMQRISKWWVLCKLLVVLSAVFASIAIGRVWIQLFSGWPSTVAAVFHVASVIAALALQSVCVFRFAKASDALLLYWLATTAMTLVILRYSFRASPADQAASILSTSTAYIVLGITALVLELKSESSQQPIFLENNDQTNRPQPNHSGRSAQHGNIITRLAFTWVTPAVNAGYKSQMFSEELLLNMPESQSNEQTNEDFFADWQHELAKPSSPSLMAVLCRGTRREVLLSGCFLLVSTVAQLSQPLILQQIIEFFHKYRSDTGVTLTDGLFLALFMGVVEAVRAVTYQRYWHVLMKSYLWLLKVLSALIYRKVLHLSNESRAQHTIGELVSYQSVDVEKVATSINYVHCIWDYPLRIIVILVLLYSTIGWCCFAGIALFVLGTYFGTLALRRVKAHVAVLFEKRDQRMRVISEAVASMKGIKLYSWQDAFFRKVDAIRNEKELNALRKLTVSSRMLALVSSLTTVFIGFATFATYEILDGTSHGPLTSQLIFVLLSLFFLIREPITEGMVVISVFINAHRSYSRIKTMALSKEIGSGTANPKKYADAPSLSTSSSDVLVSVKNGSFKWLSTEEPTLKNINIECRRNELAAVIGCVGSGKSSLVSAVLGDLVKSEGAVKVQGTVAYVPQQAWIMNATLRDNILFGNKYDHEFYNRVIDACALCPDLESFRSGDMTEIGEKGINLSGGQKARVSLARAVYSRADVYILDDPLAAVDAHVGKHLYSHVIGPSGMLKDRARILVTNNTQHLNTADYIYMLDKGRVVDHGSFKTMKRKGKLFELLRHGLSEFNSPVASQCGGSVQDQEHSHPDTNVDRQLHVSTSASASASARISGNKKAATYNDAIPCKIVTDEEHVIGWIGWNTIRFYVDACGKRNIVLLVFVALLSLIFNAATGLWLAHWADSNDRGKVDGHGDRLTHLAVYSMLGLASSVAVAATLVVLRMKCTITASKTIHARMLRSIMRSPMSFFDSTPVGRILGLFSGDQAQIDDSVPEFASKSIEALVQILITLILIIIPAPPSLLFLVPLAVAFGKLRAYFIPTTRDTRRIISRKRNIAVSTIEEALCGADSIRAYGRKQQFERIYAERIEDYMRASWTYFCTNRWLAIRLDMISVSIMFCTAVLLVGLQHFSGSISGSQVGLALTYALSIVGVLNASIRNMSMLELTFISVERARQYSFLISEAPEVIEDSRPQKSWPEQGMVEFKNYSARYREELDLVLKNLTFRVMPTQKVGIVGRTGAGKSSLALALFRIVESAEGKILLDGENIAQYGLFDVRSKLSIIPQDPVLFAGTVRENLDPFGSYPDQEIWEALQHAHLAEFIRSKDEGLDFVVSQGGDNFSVGQRQLICLARALLKRAKVLVLDEATAAIDNSTDAIIQESIRKEFKNCTVLTIAHRLNTVIDSDVVLVLDDGKIAEYDTPQNLLASRSSLFFKLAEEAGVVGLLKVAQ
ncbi:hypothetical protein IW140_000336 [Coemansia sp. RSA 1813]|nr:hypothetical protein LPJ74_000239 [Coemansia sp. RSA 1843]KAJ2573291.1 hypothetical protein IW140_000336 [Coemansia sp. RSA 1813]